MRRNDTPGRIVTNFCAGVGVHDVITSANFYDCRLWGLSVVGAQILGFSIDSRCRPYNTLALPWECVIMMESLVWLLSNDLVYFLYTTFAHTMTMLPIINKLNFFLKFKMAAAAILKITFLAITHRPIDCPISAKFCMRKQNGMSTRDR